MIKSIREKEQLVKIIKELAKDLDERAEDIANDWNKRVRSIEINTEIKVDKIKEWKVTKNYGVIVLNDELVKSIEDNLNDRNDTPPSLGVMAEIVAPVKTNPVEEIAKTINNSIIVDPLSIGIDYRNGLSKPSMFGSDG
jgi:DNA-directed RNA polymerase specialized sigma subunit